MKLSEYAKEQGICYKTAYRWFKKGLIPNSKQISTGTILINKEIKNPEDKIFIYCRVSNHSRKDEMEFQVNRCTEYSNAKGYSIEKVFKEVASGMNDNRKELWKMLNSNPTIIIVENKDRLTRFGFNYLERLLEKLNCKIEVMNKDKEDEKDLIKDLVSIITSFCCRLYGLRRGYNKALKIQREINNDNV
jgi:predicted site-specific integrase-resolvase